ncbi:MAG: DUF3769 domain-containing protein [Halothece sp.]
MLFADIPPSPPPMIEMASQPSSVSHLALNQPLETLNDGQTITQIKVAVRGGESQKWEIAQTNQAEEVLEITSDQQSYNSETQVITAKGNVTAEFAQGTLVADELRINVENRLAVGTGNIRFQRGEQVLRGDRFEYNFQQDTGVISNGGGEIFQPTLQRDFGRGLANDSSAVTLPQRDLGEQGIRDVEEEEGYQFAIGGGTDVSEFSLPETGGTVNRLRFEADEVETNGPEFNATNIRITNDPFSPPELELRADNAQLRQISPTRQEMNLSNLRLVFDDGFSLPIPRDRVIFDEEDENRFLNLISFGFDSDDRGGLFVERNIQLIDRRDWDLTLTPQYFLQEALFDAGVSDSSVIGGKVDVQGRFSPRTELSAEGSLTGLDEDVLEDNFRGNVRLQQAVGREQGQHSLNLEASFRDRLFNGSLGFQTVQSSIGAVITSPTFDLGDSGIRLSYQGGVQRINANTDVEELLEADRENDRVSLTRYQAATSLSWGTPLWRGETLPATAEEGLRYTPRPVRPNLRLTTGLTGVASFYSNGDEQNSLNASVGIRGQLGHLSEKMFDFTDFNVDYTEVIGEGESPFRFDRLVDRKRLSFGVIQQIYGPILAGFQTSLDVDDGEVISSDLILEYSRRTYNIRLRYNPTLEIGSLTIQINGFNWQGGANTFDEVDSVQDGVRR